jgi:hypothetical protein
MGRCIDCPEKCDAYRKDPRTFACFDKITPYPRAPVVKDPSPEKIKEN